MSKYQVFQPPSLTEVLWCCGAKYLKAGFERRLLVLSTLFQHFCQRQQSTLQYFVQILLNHFQRFEEALNRTGVNGRECILKTICELKETPIHNLSLLGETLTLLFTLV